MTDETRARFLAAIAAQIPAERIAEVHLFPAIRQGGMESGVAVIAVDREEPSPPDDAPVDAAAAVEPSESPDSIESDEPLDTLADASRDDAPEPSADQLPEQSAEPPPRPAPRRYTVYSARYRHTLKGPDRGKWEVNVTEEADAPLMTVDAVVRGVQRRSGDADEIVRLSGEEVRGGRIGESVSR